MATYWENSCSFGLRYVSWYGYLIVSLVFSHLGFWSGNLFLIAPFPDLCLLVPFSESLVSASKSVFLGKHNLLLYFVDGNLSVLSFNTKKVTHAVFPLGCCHRLHALAGQVSDISNWKVKVSPDNEIIGPCYKL